MMDLMNTYAIQELQKQITELYGRCEKLEGEMAALAEAATAALAILRAKAEAKETQE